MTYAADRLWEETAYLAYYLHWPLDTILDLEHPVRERVIEEVGHIHTRLAN
ncbi:DUF6760 family protein [Kitasatospora sp. NBC_00070]|uniref:DUF6760 family protein n=1 Tax=Kitasatospora sp. NBC_00070 TaxID=2975962 RepID=UPI002F910858